MERTPPRWFAPVAVAMMAFVAVAAVLATYTFATSERDGASASPAAPAVRTAAAATPAAAAVTPSNRRHTPTPTATPGPSIACKLLPQAEVEAAFGMKLRGARDNSVAGAPCTYRATGVTRAVGASVRVFGSAVDARNLLALKDWELRELPGVSAEAYAITDTPGSFTVLLIKDEVAVQLDVFDIEHTDLWAVTLSLAAAVAKRM